VLEWGFCTLVSAGFFWFQCIFDVFLKYDSDSVPDKDKYFCVRVLVATDRSD